MALTVFSIPVRGPFSLAETAGFGFGQRPGQPAVDFDGVLRLAFCLDGGFGRQVGVEIRQDGPVVLGTVHGDAPLDAVCAQVARILSLDHDATAFEDIGRREPVIRRLQLAAPGLRPPLFHSPYEAAAWAVLSARRPAQQAAAVRQRLSEQAGAEFELAGERVAAFPTPRQLLSIVEFPGLPAEKLARLHGVARAALDGRLEAARLLALGPEAAGEDLRRLDGIGPFYSQLITVRATGFVDVLPTAEPRLLELVGRLYHLPGPASGRELTEFAEAWRPMRTWAAVLIRAAAGRLRSPLAA